MAIILEPKSNGVSTESGTTITTNIPLGQRPQGDDEFDAALKKLENTFNVLVDRLNALEGSLKVLQETNKKLDEQIASMYPSNNLNISYLLYIFSSIIKIYPLIIGYIFVDNIRNLILILCIFIVVFLFNLE